MHTLRFLAALAYATAIDALRIRWSRLRAAVIEAERARLKAIAEELARGVSVREPPDEPAVDETAEPLPSTVIHYVPDPRPGDPTTNDPARVTCETCRRVHGLADAKPLPAVHYGPAGVPLCGVRYWYALTREPAAATCDECEAIAMTGAEVA